VKQKERRDAVIKLSKSRLPNDVSIKNENDYRNDPVFSLLVMDCYNKCYICEIKNLTSINVEHRKAHNGNPILKYDWHNLFLSCPHCNNIKSQSHLTALDCTQIDPESYIALSLKIEENFKTAVDVKKLGEEQDIDDTVQLLDYVYNGTTVMKKLESENLRNLIEMEMTGFYSTMSRYQSETDNNLKQTFRNQIVQAISRESRFAAFKRKIVRDTPELYGEFSKELM
jgi:hypothetical protein